VLECYLLNDNVCLLLLSVSWDWCLCIEVSKSIQQLPKHIIH